MLLRGATNRTRAFGRFPRTTVPTHIPSISNNHRVLKDPGHKPRSILHVV